MPSASPPMLLNARKKHSYQSTFLSNKREKEGTAQHQKKEAAFFHSFATLYSNSKVTRGTHLEPRIEFCVVFFRAEEIPFPQTNEDLARAGRYHTGPVSFLSFFYFILSQEDLPSKNRRSARPEHLSSQLLRYSIATRGPKSNFIKKKSHQQNTLRRI